MNSKELREARQRMGLTVEWCAANAGGVSVRSWQHWEHGRQGVTVSVPKDVALAMRFLEKAQLQALELARADQLKTASSTPTVEYHVRAAFLA